MLSRASTTSSAVENCWRTPPMARDVEPLTSSPRSATTTSSAPSSARWYATLAPTAPEPATTIRAIRARCARPRRAPARSSSRSGARTPPRTGTPRSPSTIFDAAWNGQRLQRRAQRADARAVLRRRVAHERDDRVGKARCEPGDGTGRPVREALRDERLRADEDVEPSTRYGENRSHGVSDTLRPAKFDASSRSAAIVSSGTA